jgi:hypothetical protein
LYVAVLASVPSVLLCFLFVGGATALALAGMVLVRRSVTMETLESHQDVAGFIIAIVGVVYAVLLALVVIAVWEQFEAARVLADREANQVTGLYRLTAALPSRGSERLRPTLREYAEAVVNDEWPAMRRGQSSTRAQALYTDVWNQLTSLEPQTPREIAAYQEALSRLDGFGDARRSRLLASRESLPVVMWTVLIVGAITTIGFTYFFGVRRFAAQALMTSALTITIALALFLVYSMDLPFTGDVSVPPEAFEQAIATFASLGG